MTSTAARLDAFTDAAFAFALTWMVAGSGAAIDWAQLTETLAALPSFAIGFAIVAMFWVAHVRWRALRGEGDWRSVLLTIWLIFLVLVYVAPLRAMSVAFAGYMLGTATGFDRQLGGLFAVYGVGFALMSATVALLFADARRDAGDAVRAPVTGEALIWAICAVTGLASALLSLPAATRLIAPWLYATLPLSIGLFAARWRWR